MQVKIDRAGRIVLPKAVRDKLGLAPGDSLELEQRGNRVTLFPVAAPAHCGKNTARLRLKLGSRFRPKPSAKRSTR